MENSNILNHIKQEISKSSKQIKIIFPEGTNKTFNEVAHKLEGTKVTPILVFEKKHDVPNDVLNSKHIHHYVIEEYDLHSLASYLVELRKGKETLESAKELVKQRNYFSVLMLKQDKVDGMVGGIEYSTKDILRPALQIIKTKPGIKLVSSVMLISSKGRDFLFSDCALNLYPTSEELAEIAKLSYNFANFLSFKNPQLAFLSYSTKGSGAGESVDKVKLAYDIFKKENPNAIADGEFQLDSAINPSVREKKAKNSPIKDYANILIFPNIDAGNIGYKLVQNFGDTNVAGPILLGLDKPLNDLSRGAGVEEVLNTVYITSFLSIKGK